MENQDLRARVVALETWRNQREIESARHDERWKHLDEKLDKIESYQTRLQWLVIAALIGGVAQFIFNGGMAT